MGSNLRDPQCSPVAIPRVLCCPAAAGSGPTGVGKDEERSMSADAGSFSTARLISWFSQALYFPRHIVISATNTRFNALDQPSASQIDYIIWFALGREMEKTFALPYKRS